MPALPGDIRKSIEELRGDLRTQGVFLVPVGEMEDWLADESIPEPRTNKAAWANATALCIRSKGRCQGDIWDFVQGVGEYLALQ